MVAPGHCCPAGAAGGRVGSHSLASTRGLHAVQPGLVRLYRQNRRGRLTPVAALPADQLEHLHSLHPFLSSFVDHMFLAYERVVLPCHNLGCGDVVHKSTLDPVLRLEQRGIDPKGVALVLFLAAYLAATPGVLAGAIDYYILDKLSRLTNSRAFGPENFRLGKKLAQGGFGTVYRADLDDAQGSKESEQVIVKMAKEFGEAEVWMNERLMRAAPKLFAKFITAFEEDKEEPMSPVRSKARSDDEETPLWLVWSYEGDFTLWDMMQNKSKSREGFPYNLEQMLHGQALPGPKNARRRYTTIRLILQQVLQALAACHNTGIVHRDVKPQNVIMSAKDNRAKLIDLGAAADLRVGINYVPSEFLLDPRYAPPQQYIMSTSTPRAPPLPVAAALSPILWKLNSPDRFDMYSVGIMLLQMAVPYLRSDNNLIAFRKRLESFNYDMEAWRSWFLRRHAKDAAEGFEVLNLDNGIMWDLCKLLMKYKPSERVSAPAALQHGVFNPLAPTRAFAKIAELAGAASNAIGGGWLADALGGGTRNVGLTEAQLNDELGPSYMEMPSSLRNARNTINWWQARQVAMKRAAAQGKSKQRRAAVPTRPHQSEPVALSNDQAESTSPLARVGRTPSFSLPWKPAKSSGSASAAAGNDAPAHDEVEQPLRQRSRPQLSLPFLARFTADEDDEEEEEEEVVGQARQLQRHARSNGNGRPGLQKFLPWLRTTGSTA